MAAAGAARDTGFRCVLRDREQLDALAREPLPAGLRESARAAGWHRDIYFDTADGALRGRGAVCRLRHRADGRTILSLFLDGGAGAGSPPERIEAEVADADPARALAAGSEPARRLLAFTDPVLLGPRLELEVSRIRREARVGFLRLGRCDFLYDDVTVRHGELARAFQELKVRCNGRGPDLDAIARELADRHALRPALATKLERAEAIRARLAEEALSLRVGPGRSVALAVMSAGEMAVTGSGDEMRLPTGPGAGEAACRHALHMLFQSRVGELHRIGAVDTDDGDRSFEVWLVRRVRGSAGEAPPGEISWVPLPALLDAASTGELRDPVTSAAIELVAASGLLTGATIVRPEARKPVRPPAPAPLDEVLDGPLSELAFIERVLGLAEDPRVPLLERLRYIAIVSSNLDEFYMGTGGGLRQASTPEDQEEIANLTAEVDGLLERQAAALAGCLAALEKEGVALRTWASLPGPEREALKQYFLDEIFPQLTPRAITASPGHPFPVVPPLSLAFAVVLAGDGRPQHYAYLRLPEEVPRFLPIALSTGLVPVEELVRAQLARVYPDRTVVSASLFRVTRLSELDVDESRAGNLLQAMEEDVVRRRTNPVVRIEAEASMPDRVLELLVRELRFEERSDDAGPGLGPEIRRVEGLLALGDVRELAGAPVAGGEFPAFTPRHPLAPDVPVWDQVRAADRLIHHPYDDFGTTVVRLLVAAATDPGVVSIRMTLYRAGDRSPLVDALQLAAKEGKDVSVFVELKARFDEARNVLWVRRLEAAGVHVVYGLVGLKNHAKVAMIVRREDGAIRRYVHIGTGNYNAGTARVYTDLGLMTADPVLGDDVNDFFNQLTGTSGPPRAPFQRLLVAPVRLLPGIIARIDREAEHARAGRGGRIRIKCNGLADDEVVRAFYRASQAGVEIDLVVRGICTLRPGVPGLSERIRVRSILGRFLEHARIYSFGNGGEPEYWIGSADLRPRNLRRRIEVLAPIGDPDCRRRLDALLELDLRDPTAWVLGPDGKYARPAAAVGDAASAQQTLLDGTVL